MTEQKSIPQRLLSLALPVIGLNVLNVLALGVDTAMLGRIPNAEIALTGLGFATQLMFLLMVAMMGLTVGSVALVARAHGAMQPDRVNHIVLQSTQLTVLLSIGVALLGNAVADPLLAFMGASDSSRAAGLLYMRPLLWGVVFSYLNILYAALLRGVGNTRLPFVVALIMNLLNAALNYGLILGNYGLPALGIQGAALGTIIAQAAAVAIMVSVLVSGRVPGVRLRLRPRPIDLPLASDLVRIGSPAALDMIVFNAGFLSIVGMLGRIDEVAVAAHGVGLRIQALAFVPGMSIGQATGAIVGNALGANRPEEARATARAAMVMCMILMTTLGVIFIAFAEPLLMLFDIQPGTALAGHAVTWIRLLGLTMPAVAIYIALVGVFQGSGATRISLRINIIATVLQVPLSALLGFTLGLGTFGVWLAFPIALALKSVLGVREYRRGTWAQSGASR
ncbi:MAG: MATE family multidrug resistance protein [Myxococcota bacterium]